MVLPPFVPVWAMLTQCVGYIFSTFLHFSLSRRALEELRHTYGTDLMQKHTFTVIRRTLPSSVLKEEIIRYLEYHECHNTDYMFFLFCFKLVHLAVGLTALHVSQTSGDEFCCSTLCCDQTLTRKGWLYFFSFLGSFQCLSIMTSAVISHNVRDLCQFQN